MRPETLPETLQHMAKIKEDLNKWEGIPCSQMGIINLVKMSMLPKLNYRFHAIPIKIPGVPFVEIDKL